MKFVYEKSRKLGLYFLILSACAVVGYALVTQVLIITCTSSVSGIWDVKIDSISDGSFTNAENTSGVPPQISEDGTSATFSVDLKEPRATAIYTVTVADNGNIPALLTSVQTVDSTDNLTDINSVAPTEVTFTVNDDFFGQRLNNDEDLSNYRYIIGQGETHTYDVMVTWDINSQTIPTDVISKTAVIKFNYEQYSADVN